MFDILKMSGDFLYDHNCLIFRKEFYGQIAGLKLHPKNRSEHSQLVSFFKKIMSCFSQKVSFLIHY